MAICYVYSGATGSGDGTSWGNAMITLADAFTNVTTAGNIIYVASDHYETGSTSKTLTVNAVHTSANPLRVYSVNRATEIFEPGATVITTSSITVAGGAKSSLVLMGFVLRASSFTIGNVTRGRFNLYKCDLALTATSETLITLGGTGDGALKFIELKECVFSLAGVSQRIAFNSSAVLVGCEFKFSGAEPSGLFRAIVGSKMDFIGCDLSNFSTIYTPYGETLVGTAVFKNCKLKSGYVAVATGSVGDTWSFEFIDCYYGDTHGIYEYYTYLGSLQIDTAIYCNDSISYNRSWKIVSSSNNNSGLFFATPWISAYHDGTSAITPYLEILRSGSATAFTDAEVWAEWSYKGTSGSTRATIGNDGAAPLATPANQTASSKGAADWTGENATSWFGKIGPSSSITPAEAGDISFRICVGAPSTTVYVDPQIRGLS